MIPNPVFMKWGYPQAIHFNSLFDSKLTILQYPQFMEPPHWLWVESYGHGHVFWGTARPSWKWSSLAALRPTVPKAYRCVTTYRKCPGCGGHQIRISLRFTCKYMQMCWRVFFLKSFRHLSPVKISVFIHWNGGCHRHKRWLVVIWLSKIIIWPYLTCKHGV
jgi:hypothetical protein